MPQVIHQHRQTGKTTRLIEMCAEAEAKGECSYIVVHSHNEAYRVSQLAKELGKIIGFPITFDEFLRGAYDKRRVKHLYIDEAQFLFGMLSPYVPIEAVTMTKEDNDN